VSHAIAGAKAQISDPEAELRRAQDWVTTHAAPVLLADARAVFGRDHLESAVRHAERSRDAGSMVARSLAMESLLYLSGQRQVADAIRLAGIRPDSRDVAIVLFGSADIDGLVGTMGWVRDDGVLDAEGKSVGVLGISSTEEATVPPGRRRDLALERTAILDVLR
jgi:KEOPS complex subunit Cgi121